MLVGSRIGMHMQTWAGYGSKIQTNPGKGQEGKERWWEGARMEFPAIQINTNWPNWSISSKEKGYRESGGSAMKKRVIQDL